MNTLSLEKIPDHVAFIMDGNSRWAKAHNLDPIAGHRAGIKALKNVTKRAVEVGIKYLTLYAFSTENWLRPKGWVNELMDLMRWYLNHEFKSFVKNKIRLQVIGQRELLAQDIQDLIQKVENRTQHYNSITIILAISYSGRAELTEAVKRIAYQVANQDLNPNNITSEIIENNLYTKNIPDPDLLIRTSGEQRLSNYLLWQLAYTEFIFTPTLWPDFNAKEFDACLQIFQQRQRRFGK